jgi:hypothetical protein
MAQHTVRATGPCAVLAHPSPRTPAAFFCTAFRVGTGSWRDATASGLRVERKAQQLASPATFPTIAADGEPVLSRRESRRRETSGRRRTAGRCVPCLVVEPGSFSDVGEHRQAPGVCPHDRVDLDGDVDEPVAQQEVPVPAGDPRVWHTVCASVDERADEFGIVGVDHERVPVLAEERRAAVSGQDPAGLDDGSVGLGEGVQDLVGAVAGDRAVVERQRGGVGDVELACGPALDGDIDHGGVQVDADGRHPTGGQLADGPPAPQPTSTTVSPSAS